MTREEMIEQLIQRECRVIFKKVSGEERDMMCTLDPNIIPAASAEDPLSQKKFRAVNEEVIPVWDVKAQGWRSFRVDSVISFS